MTLKEQIALRNNTSKTTVMYSREGAQFQEWALSQVNDKSHSALIGQLVTKINNNQISVDGAVREFNNSIWASR